METVKANRLMPSVILAGQYGPGQGHGGGTAHRIHHPHIQPHKNQGYKGREDNKGREGQAEQGQKDQIHMVAVEVIQQIARRRPEQNGGRRRGGEHDAHPGAGDANFLAVHRDDGDGGIKGRQHQQVGDKEKDEPSVPDFFSFFHIR